MKFIYPLYRVLRYDGLLFICLRIFHGELVEIGEQFIVLKLHFRIVSHRHTRLIVSENLVLLDLGETGSTHYDAAPLVLVDLIIGDVV